MPDSSSSRNPDAACWSIDPSVTYLNHGSFGPSPEPVQRARAQWTDRLEQQPMDFFCRRMEEELDVVETELAEWLGTSLNRISTICNSTVAMNVVAESVDLKEGDEVILTDHEYGAVRNIWSQKCRRADAALITAPVPTPFSDETVVASIADRMTSQTRMIVISHVTSATAVKLPIQAVCRMARRLRVPVCVDGPHAVAMLDVNLDEMGCDFYCASGHKWLSAPFGSGFLWVHPRHQSQIRHPVVSWGGSISGRPASWKDAIRWTGTADPAALLSMSAAVRFFDRARLGRYRTHARSLLSEAQETLQNLEGVRPLSDQSGDSELSMAALELPRPDDWQSGYHGQPDPLQIELRQRFGIEVPVTSWNGRRLIRLSAHLYNEHADYERLSEALRRCERLHKIAE